MENRSINENWEILDAAEWRLSLALDATAGEFELGAFINSPNPLAFEQFSRHGGIPLSMTKEIARLGGAWADLCIANKRATAAKNRLLRLALPLMSAWGYDAINPGPAGFRFTSILDDEAKISGDHERFRYVVKDCMLDILMSKMIAESSTLSAEKERRALAAAIPARPTPARRSGWL